VSIGISAASGAFSGQRSTRSGSARASSRRSSPTCSASSSPAHEHRDLPVPVLALPKVQSPFRRVLKGALLAGVLFEVLKRVGALYIERTTENPIYGAFAVIVGLLVWINIVSRMLLICAAWTVTAPYDSDVEPSGTANAEAAKKAGIPTEFADEDPDAAPALQEDGAPSPLAAACRGRRPRRTWRRDGARRTELPRTATARPRGAGAGCRSTRRPAAAAP
jgi:hypothetical protein